MWDPYINATVDSIGSGKIVIDRFYVMKHVNKVDDDVRKQKSKELQAKGNNDLSGSKYLRLRGKITSKIIEEKTLRV